MFRPSPALVTRGFAVVSLLVAAPIPARELSWRSIDVVATVRTDGSLAVAETQAMLMNGDWNGGERIFRIEQGQHLNVTRVVRLDPATGAEHVLQKGDLSQVDRWNWAGSGTVRWRSRAAEDPPFENALLVYRLEFSYERAFEVAADGTYRFAHDFAFADREGPIERFTLELRAAPEWRLAGELVGEHGVRRGALPARFETGLFPAGASYVVRGGLAWQGATPPALAAPSPWPRRLQRVAYALLAASALFWGVGWWRRDAALGRFAPAPTAESLDSAWLEQNVFSERPEVVGAAWDRTIDNTEVAAMLARFVAEGRMASSMRRAGWGWFGRDVLELRLLVPRESFDDDEKSLIAGLFPSGDTTDTDSLRAHYRGTGFDPVSRVRSKLERRVRALAGFGGGAKRPKKQPTFLWIIAGAAALVVISLLPATSGGQWLMAPAALLASIPGFLGALKQRSQLGVPVSALVAIAISTALFGVALWLSPTGSLGVVLLATGLFRGMFATLSTPESPGSLARRRNLAAARRLFATELAREVPRLEDRWFPWLVALGLAPECDRWSKRFRVATATAASSGGGFSGGGSTASAPSSGGTSGWSGGGGSFGGAGASAGFALAATSLAAGVPSPSSSGSSGGGGGGGGGSSSGGGGGGGW